MVHADDRVALPSGTVTLLLGDVAGSVRLWEADREAMTAAARRLDELVSEVAARHGGARPLEQSEGDSFVLVFARASDAVGCALDLQRAIDKEPWNRNHVVWRGAAGMVALPTCIPGFGLYLCQGHLACGGVGTAGRFAEAEGRVLGVEMPAQPYSPPPMGALLGGRASLSQALTTSASLVGEGCGTSAGTASSPLGAKPQPPATFEGRNAR
jgi:hypothetical protein